MDKENFDPNMINLFKQEAGKHILKVNNFLLDIEKQGVKKQTFIEMKREVHTLKGDSRMLGLIKISEASHKLEDLFELMGKEEKSMDTLLIESIFLSLDAIQNAVSKLPEELIDIDIESIIDRNKTDSIPKVKTEEIPNKNQEAVKEPPITETVKPVTETESQPIKTRHTDEKETDYISLKLKRIDDLINLFNAFPRYANRFAFLLHKLKEIKENLVEKQGGDNQLIKSLESLIYDFSHEITFYDLTAKQFQNEITKIKLVPLSTIFDLFPRLIRDIAQQTNKKINAIIKGREVELDKGVVEKLKDILIHIVNNAVDHGCEESAIREKLGKPIEGNIILSAYNKGNNIIIEVTDDGKGIDIERVRTKAVEKGLISGERAGNTPDEEMIKFIFEAGFSTKTVGKFSGRGIGMDVVAKTVKELNGEVKVNTWKNKGTSFLISLPLISYFIPVTIFQSGDTTIGIPSTHIMSALRIKNQDIKTVGDNENLINIENMDISLIDIRSIFDIRIQPDNKKESYKNVIIIKYQDEVSGLIVNEIILEKKMLIKKIPGMYEKFKIIIGAVLMEDERAIPVLDVSHLFKLLKEGVTKVTRVKEEITKKFWAKNILLVEDSLITRDHEKRILVNQNLNVFEASNGREGIKQLENRNFDLIITDIEMPVMDGFEFVKYIKADSRYSQIPVIVVSSYKDYQVKIKELGVNHFISKNDFSAQLFINILKEENIV